GRDLCNEIEETQHRVALADDILEVVALFECSLELNDLFLCAMSSDSCPYVGQQFLVIPRLLNEVLGTGADGVHYVAHGPVSGNHDDRQVGLQRRDSWQEVYPAFTGQGEVQQQQIVIIVRELLYTGR